MQKLYEEFGELTAIRIVYIKEAHAADGSWPVGYAKELGITEHQTYGQRCQTAERLLRDKNLTIPTLIDNMDDQVNRAYQAHPDRVYLVRKDGTLAVAAKPGPWGFKPGLNAARKWLAEYKRTGEEPPLPDPDAPDSDEEGEASAAEGEPDTEGPPIDERTASAVVGQWQMMTELGDRKVESVMTLTWKDEKVVGVWSSQGRESTLKAVNFSEGRLSFKRAMGPGMELQFEGTVKGDTISGKYTTPFGEIPSTGKREPS